MPMAIYAISALHLSLSGQKPMHVFGEPWRDHDRRIAANWDAMVQPEDTVLICGDISWATRFEQAREDLAYIAERPGRKVMIRGNHDYWWRREATNRLQRQMHESIHLMHGHSLLIEGCAVTGTRGWRLELEDDPDAGDEKVLRRELMYLERGLQELDEAGRKRIVMLHYPPFNADLAPNDFADLLQAYDVDIVVYGHVHTGYYLEGDYNGIQLRLVSVDHTDFRPVLIAE